MAGKAIHRLEELEIWKSAMRTAVKVCRLFQRFPDYVFGDLICRSAVSVPSNIAEGFDRGSNQDHIRFLWIAQGSNTELRSQLYLARELEFAATDRIDQLIADTETNSARIEKLIQVRERSSTSTRIHSHSSRLRSPAS